MAIVHIWKVHSPHRRGPCREYDCVDPEGQRRVPRSVYITIHDIYELMYESTKTCMFTADIIKNNERNEETHHMHTCLTIEKYAPWS